MVFRKSDQRIDKIYRYQHQNIDNYWVLFFVVIKTMNNIALYKGLIMKYKKTLFIVMATCFLSLVGHTQLNRTGSGSTKEISPFGAVESQWYKLQWFYDLNIGGRFFGPSSDAVNLNPGLSFNAGMGYMFKDIFGIKGRIDYHRFTVTPGFTNNSLNKAGSVSMSAEILTDLVPMFDDKDYHKFRMGLHAGFGITSVFNPEYKSYREDELGKPWKDPFIKGNDDMVHIIAGVTPQYHINGRWSLNLDISSYFQFIGDYTIDQFNKEVQNRSALLSTSIGLTFRP